HEHEVARVLDAREIEEVAARAVGPRVALRRGARGEDDEDVFPERAHESAPAFGEARGREGAIPEEVLIARSDRRLRGVLCEDRPREQRSGDRESESQLLLHVVSSLTQAM